jgi:hypothetical protein
MLKSVVRYPRTIAHSSSFAASLLSIVMFLLFPAQIRPHDYNDHFRTPRVRASIVGHTSVERAEVRTADQAVKTHAWPPLSLVVEPDLKRRTRPEAVCPMPRTRLFLRLKLGPSSSSSQDPLS